MEDLCSTVHNFSIGGIQSIAHCLEHKPYLKALYAYGLWIFVGTIFYAVHIGDTVANFREESTASSATHSINDASQWQLGFFMAVNVGYCIGWDFPINGNAFVKIFSLIYMFIGASAVAAALAYFAHIMIESSKNWYLEALQEHEYRGTSNMQFTEKWLRWITLNWNLIKAVALWLAWLVALLAFTMSQYPDWDFLDSLFFTCSSLTTAGLSALPESSSSGQYFLLAVLTATGIPITAMAMSNVANLLLVTGDSEDAVKKIYAKVTAEELAMMQQFGLDDGDGKISKGEYILLCAVRLGALSPDLIAKINERFDQLDVFHDGMLSYGEITQNKLLIQKENRDCFEKGMLSIEEFVETSKKLGGSLSAEEVEEEVEEAALLERLSSQNSLLETNNGLAHEAADEESLEMSNLLPTRSRRHQLS